MSDEDAAQGVVLDFLAHGRSDDDRPGYQREPICYAMGVDDFQLYEIVFESPPDLAIGERIPLEPMSALPDAVSRDQVTFDGLSSGAAAEVEYVVEELVDEREDRFMRFFNESQPVSLRLHQLNLLPGIGEKLRDGILDERRRRPFEGFDDLEERVDGLHDPRGVLVERIMAELRDPDMKYYLFVGSEALLARQ